MTRLAASILALGLAATAGSASARTPYGSGAYGQPSVSRYGQYAGAYYDYARVLRVDPVIVAGDDNDHGRAGAYPAARRCYRTENDAGDDRYARYPAAVYGDNGYGAYASSGYRNDGYGNDGYRNDGYRNDGYRNDEYGNAGANVATVVGGLVGAALGSQVGGGSARYATAAVGTMIGGMAGREVYDNARRSRRTASVVVCDPRPFDQAYGNGYGRDVGYAPDDGRVSGYDVTYEYAGRTYTTRTGYNPGNRIRVRVDVSPG